MKLVFYGWEIQKAWIPTATADVEYVFVEGCRPIPPTFSLPADTSLLVTLGGDGTFLEALPLLQGQAIPVTGINFGRLGFLAGSPPEFLEQLIDCFRRGQYEERHHTVVTLEATGVASQAEGMPGAVLHALYPYALNEVSIQRLGPAMLEMDVKVNGRLLTTYRGDGLIAATPTGSTAYSLSVGGPVVFPQARVLTVSPISPHNLNVRPVVLPDNVRLDICVHSRSGRALLALDNRSVEVPDGFSFAIKKAPYVLTTLSFEENDFLSTLREKLLWGFDIRNGGSND